MAKDVEVDPGVLLKAAEETEHIHDKARNILDTLKSSLAARGAPWGDDKYGRQFFDGDGGNGYRSGRAELLEGGQAIVKDLGEFARRQRKGAKELTGIEQRNRKSFN